MNKPLIAVDLDGTLLDASGRYSEATRDYLRRLSSAGFEIVLASGRPYRSIEPIYRDLNLRSPIICYNGALVFHPFDRSFGRINKTFPKESIISIYEKTKGYVDAFMAESPSRIYVNRRDERLGLYFPFEGMDVIEGDYGDILKEDVYTCLFSCPIDHHDLLESVCNQHQGIRWRSWTNSIYSELFIPGANKGSALSFVMDQLGAKKEDVYAFGDASNDIDMLRQAGHPFAMKGCRVPDLMKDFTTTKNSVDEDGVMVELQRLFRL